MARTNFPNGITDKGQARIAGRSEVTGKATIATGLAKVTGVIASLEAIPAAASKKPFAVSAKASGTAGSIDVVVADTSGVEANTAVFVNWQAFGS